MKAKTILSAVLSAGLLATVHADMFRPSRNDQIKLGQQASAEVRKKEKVVSAEDPRVQLMRNVAARLIAASPDPEKSKWPYSFDVIQNKAINAFALPGGPIFFYSGLVDKLTTEDQLAGVLAHELQHVRKEHWARAYEGHMKRQLGITVVLLLLRANRTAFDLASVSYDLLVSLPYSRRDETQADDLGYEMMVKAGYNPTGMAEVFKILKDSMKGGKPPEWLNTHPDDGKRIQRIEDRIQKSNQTFPVQRPLPWRTTPSGGLLQALRL